MMLLKIAFYTDRALSCSNARLLLGLYSRPENILQLLSWKISFANIINCSSSFSVSSISRKQQMAAVTINLWSHCILMLGFSINSF